MHSDRHRPSPVVRLTTATTWGRRALAAGALFLAWLPISSLHAQTSGFLACTPGDLVNCTEIRLTSTLGGGMGGSTLFQIALRNAGSTTRPTLPTSVYNLVFGTGLPTAAPGTEVSAAIVPVAVGGATRTDDSPWDLFEQGDFLFLSALTNNGVGGCVAGAAIGGFGQAGNSCGAGQYLTFSFSTPRAFDPRMFVLLDMEVVGLAPELPGDSCGEEPACVIRPVGPTTVPEPTTPVLLATGLLLLAGSRGWRRRRTAAAGSGAAAIA